MNSWSLSINMKFAICILLSLCGHALSQQFDDGQTQFGNGLSDFPGQFQPAQPAQPSQFQPAPNNQPFTNNQFVPREQTASPEGQQQNQFVPRGQTNPAAQQQNQFFPRGQTNPAAQQQNQFFPRGQTNPVGQQQNQFFPRAQTARPFPQQQTQFFPRGQTPRSFNQPQNRPRGRGNNGFSRQNPQSFSNSVPLNIRVFNSDDFTEEDGQGYPTIYLNPSSGRQNQRSPAFRSEGRRSSSPQVFQLQLIPFANTNSQNQRRFPSRQF